MFIENICKIADKRIGFFKINNISLCSGLFRVIVMELCHMFNLIKKYLTSTEHRKKIKFLSFRIEKSYERMEKMFNFIKCIIFVNRIPIVFMDKLDSILQRIEKQ